MKYNERRVVEKGGKKKEVGEREGEVAPQAPKQPTPRYTHCPTDFNTPPKGGEAHGLPV